MKKIKNKTGENKIMEKKIRLLGEYTRVLNTKLHEDGMIAREAIAEKFRGQYFKYQLDTFVFLAFKRIIEEKKIKKGQDLEMIFKI